MVYSMYRSLVLDALLKKSHLLYLITVSIGIDHLTWTEAHDWILNHISVGNAVSLLYYNIDMIDKDAC